jgi:uncharacterized protein (DUF433 family)
MDEMDYFDRIVSTPDVLGGKARIRGHRVTVATLVGQIGAGYSIDEVLADYPSIERDDILQALQYAACLAQGKQPELAAA